MNYLIFFFLSIHSLNFMASEKIQNSKMNSAIPCAVSTWKFGAIAIKEAYVNLLSGSSALDAIEKGINAVELDTAEQYFVGVGGLPNAEGEMEFDAAIMDHESRYSAVLCLQDIATPVSVARAILDHSPHNVLSGKGALQFALEHGFIQDKTVLTDASRKEWLDWMQQKLNDGKVQSSGRGNPEYNSEKGHDTVGLICLDAEGRLACGTSTSGWKFKHPGRVGDSALPGGGLFCDGAVGAAVCTGDGEEIQRSCLAFLVVELMRNGLSPQAACSEGIRRMTLLKPKRSLSSPESAMLGPSPSPGSGMYTQLTVAVVAMDAKGNVGAASTLCESNLHRGQPYFPASCWRASVGETQIQASLGGAAF